MRRSFALIAITGVVWLGLAPAAPASAVEDCTPIVIDSTSNKVLGDITEIEAAALQLENIGIDVRVRAFEKQPTGGISTYQKEHVRSCPDWQGPGGFTKGNLVTLLFSMDRQSSIFYGSNLEAELDGHVDRIRADFMNAEFKNGDFPKAITGTMKEMTKVIKEYNSPKPDGTTVVNNEASSGGNAFGWVAAVLVGLAALVALLFGGALLVRARRRHKERLEQARIDAVEADKNAATATTALSTFTDVKRDAELIMPFLNEQDQQLLKGLIAQFEKQNRAVVAAAGIIMDNPSEYLLSKERKLAGYQRITAAHNEVSRCAGEAQATIASLDIECKNKASEIKEAPKSYEGCVATLAQLRAECNRLETEGYRLKNLAPEFAAIDALLATAKAELEAKRNGQALDELRTCKTKLDSVRETLTRTPQRHQEILADCSETAVLLKKVEKLTKAAQGTRRNIDGSYENAVEDLMGDEEASGLLKDVADFLERARGLASLEVQKWDDAEKDLVTCNSALEYLSTANQLIEERAAELARLRQSLPTVLTSIATQIAEIKAELTGRKGSQETFKNDLTAANRSVKVLRAGLNARMPDLWQFKRSADALKNIVGAINTKSKKEDKEKRRQERSRTQSSSRRDDGGFTTGVVMGSVWNSGGGGHHDGGGGWSGGDSGSHGGSSGGSWGGGDGGSSGGGGGGGGD